jgi:DNA processing protein
MANAVSPYREMVAYETLWGQQNQSLRKLAELFKRERVLPSELLRPDLAGCPTEELQARVESLLRSKTGFSVAVHGAFQYPERLQQAKYPIELFYYRGDIGLLESSCISVVGSRKCTEAGKAKTKELVTELVRRGFTIVSGLALGIDTVALKTAVAENGKVVGVIGTPIDQYYPAENRELQDLIANEHLLISQVPFFRYSVEPFKSKRNYFPQRNETMSALSEATVIVEASDTSGTLTQARAALQQGRKLFVLDSCFQNQKITWPRKFAERGAIRVQTAGEITAMLGEVKEP